MYPPRPPACRPFLPPAPAAEYSPAAATAPHTHILGGDGSSMWRGTHGWTHYRLDCKYAGSTYTKSQPAADLYYCNTRYSSTFVQAFQGSRTFGKPDYGSVLGVAATCKHFAAYSRETERFSSNANVTAQDLAESYLPAFKMCISDGRCPALLVKGLHGQHWVHSLL